MSSVFTNIYNKKTKGPTLMELFTATGKLKKFFLTTRNIRCVHHSWHGTHRYDIQVLATHTHQHGCIDILYCLRSVRSRGNGGTNTFACFARNARSTVTTDLLCDIPTHKMTSPPEQPFSHYIHSHRLAEIWTTMKNKLQGKKVFSYSFYLYRFCKYVSYGLI